MQTDYESVSIFIPSHHGYHQSLVFVVGELHPVESIDEKTRERLGKVVKIDDGDVSWVRIDFENGSITFNNMIYCSTVIKSKKSE